MTQDKLFEFIVKNTLSGYWEWNINTNERFYSASLKEVLGYNETEITTDILSWSKLHLDKNFDIKIELIKAHFLKAPNTVLESTVKYLHKNGSTRWLLSRIRTVEFDTDAIPVRIIASTTDVTTLKNKALEQVALSNNLNYILKSSTNISIISTDTDGLITHFNKGAEKLLGYRAEEMIGLKTPEVIHDPAEVISHGNYLSELFNKKIEGFGAFVELAKQGQYESKVWTYIRKDGSQFPVQLAVTALRNDENEIIGFLGIGTDISELKETQSNLVKTNEHISFQNKKLLDFTYIASHNLKTHARNISMLLQLLDKKAGVEEKEDILNLVRDNAKNLYNTIESLNEIVQVQSGNHTQNTQVNISAYVEKVLDILKIDLERINAKLQVNVSRDVTINYNPIYLESIVYNLVSNAIKYRSINKTLSININLHIQNNKPVLSVEDNGLGIDLTKYGHKIFGLFKTFHQNSDAKGVGLYITKNQVESMGGQIELQSAPDKGTKFTVRL